MLLLSLDSSLWDNSSCDATNYVVCKEMKISFHLPLMSEVIIVILFAEKLLALTYLTFLAKECAQYWLTA